MKRLVHLGVWTVVLLGLSAPTPAEAKLKKVAQSGLKFLSNPVGARSAALGAASMAVTEDASAIFWNPAGLARLQTKTSAIFDATSGIADINYFAGAVAYNAEDYGIFGVHALVMDYGDFERTELDASQNVVRGLGTFSPTAFALGVSYARTMTDRFGFGANLKWARLDLGTVTTQRSIDEPTERVDHVMNQVVFDVGVMYYTHIRGIRFGASFRNFAREKKFVVEEFSPPLELKFGWAVDVIDLLSLHGLGPSHAFTFMSDFQHSRDFSTRLHYGGEYWYRNTLALRGGYKSNYDEEDFTFGAGLKFHLQEDYAVGFDYAFNDFGVFEEVHKFSLALDF